MLCFSRFVAFDLDGTLWGGWLNEANIGLMGRVSNKLEDNLELVGDSTIIDRMNRNFCVKMSPDIPIIFAQLISNGLQIAIVSRNTNKKMHFKKIFGWSRIRHRDMLFFDDQAINLERELWQGTLTI
ncbi:hypothetical protein B0T24DRAFT_593285 [Lasiosphaeria ovina]|uniref:Magnesium-dependent phosphatase-1 n=1 Tax=Lasiosphaeria ovina TaxID=92902 RepID=A0AAE0KAE6_9PEZI|nr:hypothetical protein B0T24DRAFT_593285 [Lasiosphaeria ovina]